MASWLALPAFVVGLVILVRAADLFVVAAEGVAVRWRWSPGVIGAVIIGFGTSLPELVISTSAAGRGEVDLAIGNAAGSNVVNLLLVLGVTALVVPIRGAPSDRPRHDGMIAAIAGLVLLAVAADGRIGLLESGILIVALVTAGWWQVRTGQGQVDQLDLDVPTGGLGWRLVVGLVGVLGGAQLVVEGAVVIADAAGVPPIVVGSVIVAVGTSLPELATCIAAARRGRYQLLFGNLLGSNVFNALMVVGASGVAAAVRDQALTVDRAALAVVAAAAVVTLGVAVALARRAVITRAGGAVLVVLYLAAIPALLAVS